MTLVKQGMVDVQAEIAAVQRAASNAFEGLELDHTNGNNMQHMPPVQAMPAAPQVNTNIVHAPRSNIPRLATGVVASAAPSLPAFGASIPNFTHSASPRFVMPPSILALQEELAKLQEKAPALFSQMTTTVYVNEAGELSSSEHGEYHPCMPTLRVPKGAYPIEQGLTGRVGESMHINVDGRSIAFDNIAMTRGHREQIASLKEEIKIKMKEEWEKQAREQASLSSPLLSALDNKTKFVIDDGEVRRLLLTQDISRPQLIGVLMIQTLTLICVLFFILFASYCYTNGKSDVGSLLTSLAAFGTSGAATVREKTGVATQVQAIVTDAMKTYYKQLQGTELDVPLDASARKALRQASNTYDHSSGKKDV